MLPTITPTQIDIPPGGEVILRHQTWDDYEALLHTRADKAAIKITKILGYPKFGFTGRDRSRFTNSTANTIKTEKTAPTFPKLTPSKSSQPT